jgi:hypothetical protein
MRNSFLRREDFKNAIDIKACFYVLQLAEEKLGFYKKEM